MSTEIYKLLVSNIAYFDKLRISNLSHKLVEFENIVAVRHLYEEPTSSFKAPTVAQSKGHDSGLKSLHNHIHDIFKIIFGILIVRSNFIQRVQP